MKERSGIQTQFAGMRSDYEAARENRYRRRPQGLPSAGSGANWHYSKERDWLKLIEYSRHFDRNDMVAGQAITRLVDHVLRRGPQLEVNTGDEAVDDALHTRFMDWAEDPGQCDRMGRDTFLEIAKLSLRSMVVDGDIFNLPLRDGSIETLEAHRCRTPRATTKNVIHGVLLDNCLKPLSYWFTNEDVDTSAIVQKVGEVRQIPARFDDGSPAVFHTILPKRRSQTRGIGNMVTVFNAIGMHDDLEFAKLVQAQIVSCYAIFREQPEESFNPDAAATGSQSNESRADGSTRVLEGISPGMVIQGMPGEKLNGFTPGVPNAEFFQHARLILGFIAVNLGIPLMVMLLDPSESNFSSWRGAMDAAKPGFESLLQMMVKSFFRPVYRWKVKQFLLEDPALMKLARQAGVNPYGHRWIAPKTPYIEPNKDAMAEETIIDGLLNSRREVLAGRGLDVDDIDRQIIKDNKALILAAALAAKEISGQVEGVEVSWRDILRPVDVKRSMSVGEVDEGNGLARTGTD